MEKSLYKTKWLELKSIDTDNYSYVFSHEVRCGGKIVSILPFRRKNDGYEYLLRSEITPCWGEDPVISTITGGVENNNIFKTALLELEEETGYVVDSLLDLGNIYISKSADTLAYLFSVDLSDKSISIFPSGDGSYLESRASCLWFKDVSQSMDPLAYAIYYKLRQYI